MKKKNWTSKLKVGSEKKLENKRWVLFFTLILVVTAPLYQVLNPLANGNEVQFEPGTRTKDEGDQVSMHIFQFRG